MAGVERGMKRLYHKHALIMQMSHTPSVLKNVMSYMFVYMFVFEVYIPIVVSS